MGIFTNLPRPAGLAQPRHRFGHQSRDNVKMYKYMQNLTKIYHVVQE